MYYKIAPSILSADFGSLAHEVRRVEEGGADLIHVDVMDGHFVPNLTIGPPVIKALRAVTDLPLDVHLMIERPDESLASYAEAGADIIGVHVEACVHLHRTLSQIRKLGKKSCVVLNPATPLESIYNILDLVDTVLVMTVNPGFGGQSFITTMLDKISTLREHIDKERLTIDIEVDGGVKLDNISRIAGAGANVFVSGSGIFKTDDYAATISKMRKAVEG